MSIVVSTGGTGLSTCCDIVTLSSTVSHKPLSSMYYFSDCMLHDATMAPRLDSHLGGLGYPPTHTQELFDADLNRFSLAPERILFRRGIRRSIISHVNSVAIPVNSRFCSYSIALQ